MDDPIVQISFQSYVQKMPIFALKFFKWKKSSIQFQVEKTGKLLLSKWKLIFAFSTMRV